MATPKKIAIVCEWLVGIGGAEREVLEIHRLFPDAPIYTSQYDPTKIDWFEEADVRTGWLQRVPASLKKFLPVLRAWYFSRLDLSQFDVVITVNFGAEAKALKFRPPTVHVCICNAPSHYYWSRYEAYLKDPGFPKGFNWLGRLGLRLLVSPLRRWDFKAAQKPTHMIAISSHIKREIKKYYRRDAEIIHPPVEVARFRQLPSVERKGFIIIGRQTPYKRVDLAVAACTKVGVPLTVIGSGPEHERLRRMAGPHITFLGHVEDRDIPKHLASAEAFIFPNLDDFGITPVEAMACGTPVIAFRAGGALDYVVEGKTGAFFDEQTVDALARVLTVFTPTDYAPADCKAQAERFSAERYHQAIRTYIERVTTT